MRELIRQYQSITIEIIRLQQKIEAIYSSAANPKIKKITGMPMSPGFSGGGLETIFIRTEEIEEQVCALKAKRDDVGKLIMEQLDTVGLSDIEKQVFWYREIDGLKWKEIGKLTKYSISHLHRFYRKAIYMMQLL